MKVNGIKGYFCETTAVQNDLECYFAQFFTVIDDSAYVFTFTADEEGYDDLIDEVKEIVETLNFSDVSGL